MLPAIGAEGVTGCALIITVADAAELHPAALVTVNVCDPEVKPVTVVPAPDPDIAPGLIVQIPAGSPLKATLPVATKHVGCVIKPVIGADGVAGCVFITIFADAPEVHPAALVTV